MSEKKTLWKIIRLLIGALAEAGTDSRMRCHGCGRIGYVEHETLLCVRCFKEAQEIKKIRPRI